MLLIDYRINCIITKSNKKIQKAVVLVFIFVFVRIERKKQTKQGRGRGRIIVNRKILMA